jgi:hypothetical protein
MLYSSFVFKVIDMASKCNAPLVDNAKLLRMAGQRRHVQSS